MSYTPHQQKFLTNSVKKDILCIEKLFNEEVNRWKSEEHKIKLLILAEAPLSCKGYLYNNKPGNFLSSLKEYFNVVGQNKLLGRLRYEGIFVMDMYEFPINTKHYDNDSKTHFLFNDGYLMKKLNKLRHHNLLTDETYVVFRYKKLAAGYFDMKIKKIPTSSLDTIPYTQWIFGTLNISERPQIISPVMKAYI